MEQIALLHSQACCKLIEWRGVEAALSYCAAHQVELPTWVRQANAAATTPMSELAMRTIGDKAWWTERLRVKASIDAELNLIREKLSKY